MNKPAVSWTRQRHSARPPVGDSDTASSRPDCSPIPGESWVDEIDPRGDPVGDVRLGSHPCDACSQPLPESGATDSGEQAWTDGDPAGVSRNRRRDAMCVSGQACASGLLDALLHGAADGHKKSRSQSQERPQSWAVERKTGFEPATPILARSCATAAPLPPGAQQ